MHPAVHYIGTPWSPHGEGPDNFHCWAFFCLIQKTHYGRTVPPVVNPRTQAKMFRAHVERKRWVWVEVPLDGDGVLMRQSRVPVHVGTWLEVDGGGILHCAEGAGVVFQRPDALALNGWRVEGYYRFLESKK